MADDEQEMHFQASDQLSPQEKTRDAIITALLWAVYLYLWVPLVSLLAWALGFEFAYDVMVRAGGADDLIPILLQYAVVISVIVSAFTLWSLSNRLRFRHMTRRSRRAPVPDEALAKYFDIPMSQIATMRSRQILHVSLDEAGRPSIIGVGIDGIYDDEWISEPEDEDPEEETPLRDASIAS